MLQPKESPWDCLTLHLSAPPPVLKSPLSSSPCGADAVTKHPAFLCLGLCSVLCWKHTVVVSIFTSPSTSSPR